MKNIILFLPLIFTSCVTNAETFPVKPCLVALTDTQVVNANFVESISFIQDDPSTKEIIVRLTGNLRILNIKSEKPKEDFVRIFELLKSKCQ